MEKDDSKSNDIKMMHVNLSGTAAIAWYGTNWEQMWEHKFEFLQVEPNSSAMRQKGTLMCYPY